MGSNYGKKTPFCCVHFVFQIYHKLHFQHDNLVIESTRDRFPWEKRQNKALGAFDVVNDSIIRGFSREPLCPGLARFSCLSNWILSITKRLESRIADRGPWSLGNFKSVTQVRCDPVGVKVGPLAAKQKATWGGDRGQWRLGGMWHFRLLNSRR